VTRVEKVDDQNLKLGEYVLENPLRSENSGFSEWGFGRKDGQTYFIKKFLSPVYPPENGRLGARIVEKKKAMCEQYESEKKALFWKINEVSDGNLLRIHEFFRYGTHYYIATEKVEAMDFTEEVLSLSLDEKIVLMKVLCHALSSLHKAGLIHGDIKLNNVLFDRETGRPLCVIDLDTVMPGLAAYDFGDSIRFGANHNLEDERDLDRVEFDLHLYEVYAAGFLRGSGAIFGKNELQSLAWGARIITLEQAIRFLTDYLEGDCYYHTDREGQNLDRARVQIKLLSGMEEHFGQMLKIVEDTRA
jgi:serine/threonine protein kinase